MATLVDISRSLKQAVRDLQEDIPVALAAESRSLKSLAQNRVQTTGQGTQRNRLPAQYADSTKRQRTKKGLQTGFVDLTATGRTWRETDFVRFGQTNGNPTAFIGPTTERAKTITDAQTERYGNFADNTDEELNEAAENIADIIDERLQDAFRGR